MPSGPRLHTAHAAAVTPPRAGKASLKKALACCSYKKLCQISLLLSLDQLNGSYTNICYFVRNLALCSLRAIPKEMLCDTFRVFVFWPPSVNCGIRCGLWIMDVPAAEWQPWQHTGLCPQYWPTVAPECLFNECLNQEYDGRIKGLRGQVKCQDWTGFRERKWSTHWCVAQLPIYRSSCLRVL